MRFLRTASTPPPLLVSLVLIAAVRARAQERAGTDEPHKDMLLRITIGIERHTAGKFWYSPRLQLVYELSRRMMIDER